MAGYIGAAYWFTSSTSFANPAVTIARTLTDTFAGIEPSSAPMFVLAHIAGIDIAREYPKRWTDEIVRAADVIVTMGCGDAYPYYLGIRYDGWALEDPHGQGIDAVRPIWDEIERRVRALLSELGVEPAA